MAGFFLKPRLQSALDSLGWKSDSIETSLTHLRLNGLKSSETYRGCSIASVDLSIGLTTGIALEISDAKLNFLLSKGEVELVTPAYDPKASKAKIKKQNATFLSSVFSRMIEGISITFLRASSVVLKNIEVRLESCQSGRSFAATLQLEKLAFVGCNNKRDDVGIQIELVGMRMYWESQPSSFVYLGSEPSVSKASVFVHDIGMASTVYLSDHMKNIRVEFEVKKQLVVAVSDEQIQDILSLSNGAGLPNAWGLDRSPKALWKRAADTIHSRRKFAKDKERKRTLARLHVSRMASASYEEFLINAEIILAGDKVTSVSTEKSSGAPAYRISAIINFEVAQSDLHLVSQSKNLRIALGATANSPIRLQVDQVDGTSSIVIDDASLVLPLNGALRFQQLHVSTDPRNGSEIRFEQVGLSQASSLLFVTRRCHIQASPKGSSVVTIDQMFFKEEWPKLWDLFLNVKAASQLVQDAAAASANDGRPSAAAASKAYEKTSMTRNKTVSKEQPDVKTSKVSIGSLKVFPIQSGAMEESEQGYGITKLTSESAIDSSMFKLEIERWGELTENGGDLSKKAVTLDFRSEDQGQLVELNATFSRVGFAINVPLLAFWADVKGPPPSLPPVLEPIRSLLPLTLPEHSIRLKFDECAILMGEEIHLDWTSSISSVKSREFLDAETFTSSRSLPSSSSSSADEFFEVPSTIFSADHVVEVSLKQLKLDILQNLTFLAPSLDVKLKEGRVVGGTIVLVTDDGDRPSLQVGNPFELSKFLLRMSKKLAPYPPPPVPVIPLDYRYYPELHVRLSGIEATVGKSANFVWDGMQVTLDSNGGGNFVSLNRFKMVVWPCFVLYETSSASDAIRSSQVVSFPQEDVDADCLFNVVVSFVHVNNPLQKHAVDTVFNGGEIRISEGMVKDALEEMKLLKTFQDDLLAEGLSGGGQAEEGGKLDDTSNAILLVEDHDLIMEYRPDSSSANVVAQQHIHNFDVSLEMRFPVTVRLCERVEFSLDRFELSSLLHSLIEDDSDQQPSEERPPSERNFVIESSRDLLFSRRRDLIDKEMLLSEVTSSKVYRETAMTIVTKCFVQSTPLIHPVTMKCVFGKHSSGKPEISIEVFLVDPIRIEIERQTLKVLNDIADLVSSTSAQPVEAQEKQMKRKNDDSVKGLPSSKTRAELMANPVVRFRAELPGTSVSLMRTCSRTKRKQTIYKFGLGDVELLGLMKRAMYRGEFRASASALCLDGIQVLDPCRIVIICRGISSDEYLISPNIAKLDVDFRAVDPFDVNITQDSVHALQLCQEMIASVKNKTNDGRPVVNDEESKFDELTCKDFDANDIDQVVIYREHEGGFYVENSTNQVLYGYRIQCDAVTATRPTSDENDDLSCFAWIKKCDVTGLGWDRRLVRLSPLAMALYEGEEPHSPCRGVISLLDPVTYDLLQVTMEGDSDEDLGNRIDLAAGGSMAVILNSTKSFLQLRKQRNKANQEAKSVRSFQLVLREKGSTSTSHGFGGDLGRSIRFIASDTKTKVRLLEFLSKARKALLQVENHRAFARHATACSRVYVENAQECFAGETHRMKPGVRCFAELDGSCLTFFSRSVPRRGGSRSAKRDEAVTTTAVEGADLTATLGPSSTSVVATEFQRDHFFIGHIDLMFAIAVFRENNDQVNSIYIESSQAPTRIRLHFDTYEDTRKWERNIAETISLTSQVKRAFLGMFAKKEFVFSCLRKVDFKLKPEESYHVDDDKFGVVLGNRLATKAEVQLMPPARGVASREDEKMNSEDEAKEVDASIQYFHPDLLIKSSERCHNDGASIFAKDDDMNSSSAPLLRDSEPVVCIQGKAVLKNLSQEVLKLKFALFQVEMLGNVTETTTEVEAKSLDRSSSSVRSIIAYGVRNDSSSDVVAPSWSVISPHPLSAALDERREEKFLAKQTRWFILTTTTTTEILLDLTQVALSQPNLGSSAPMLSLVGFVLGPDSVQHKNFSLHPDQEISIPPEYFPSLSGGDNAKLMCISTLFISSGSTRYSVQSGRLSRKSTTSSNAMDWILLSDPHEHAQATYYSSNQPQFVVNQARYSRSRRLFFYVERMLTVRNSLPIPIFFSQGQDSTKALRLDANNGELAPSEFLYSAHDLRSVVRDPFARVVNSIRFSLDPSYSLPGRECDFQLISEDIPFQGWKRVTFENGNSAIVTFEAGHRKLLAGLEDVGDANDDLTSQAPSQPDLMHFGTNGNGASSNSKQMDYEDDRMEAIESLSHRCGLPIAVTIDARIRMRNATGMDLFIRRKKDYSEPPLLLGRGQNGFIADPLPAPEAAGSESSSLLLRPRQTFIGDTSLEISLATRDIAQSKWSNAFACKVGVSGVVETFGLNANQAYKFGVEVSQVKDGRGTDILVSIVPFYTICNMLQCPLELVQVGTSRSISLPMMDFEEDLDLDRNVENGRVEFHPLDIDGNGVVDDSELFVRVRQQMNGTWTNYSAPFRLDIVQEQVLICDRVMIDNTEGSVPKSPLLVCNSSLSAHVSPNELSETSMEGEDEESNGVFAVRIALRGPGIEASFIRLGLAKGAIKYNVVNSTVEDVIGIREKVTLQQGQEPPLVLPIIAHPKKTVPYVFRTTSRVVFVSVLKLRREPPVEVDLSNVGWSHRFDSAPGLFLEIVETPIGRCLTFGEEDITAM